jgi:hypothetical protein
MMARADPEMASLVRNGNPAESDQTIVFSPVKSAPKKAPASRLISTPKPQSDTGIKRTRKPKGKRTAKPPKTDGYTWRKDGAGWELRKAVYDETDTGISKRRLPYLGHLSKSAFQDMRKRHKGKALDSAISRWIADHDR